MNGCIPALLVRFQLTPRGQGLNLKKLKSAVESRRNDLPTGAFEELKLQSWIEQYGYEFAIGPVEIDEKEQWDSLVELAAYQKPTLIVGEEYNDWDQRNYYNIVSVADLKRDYDIDKVSSVAVYVWDKISDDQIREVKHISTD